MKVGLFFGSFNPIHIGHLIIAHTMVEHTDLQEVWFVISPHNPHKKKESLLHAFDRYDMVEKAIYDNPRFRACDIEFHLPQPNYTIHTLVHLQEKYPQKQFIIILGSDNLVNFKNWKNYQEILKHYELYVYPRPHTPASELDKHPKVKWVQAPLIDISATYLRECIRAGKSIRYLVPQAVEEIIKRKKFYQ